MKIEVGDDVITALWEGADPIDHIRDYFNHDVVVEGIAVFRPSGSLLRLDVDAIRPPQKGDELFRRVPIAVSSARRNLGKVLRTKTSDSQPYARIFQSIPGEETDEDFAAAVEAAS